MNQRLDDHPLHDPELDARLVAAMQRIAGDYRPMPPTAAAEEVGHRRRTTERSGRTLHVSGRTLGARRRRLVTSAAAAAVVVGIAGVVAVDRSAGDPSVAPSTVAAAAAAPVWGEGFVVPEVPAPQWGVRFDPSLAPGEHDLELLNRYASWLYTTEPTATRWFFRHAATGWGIGATINVSEYPLHAVNPDDLDPDDADGDGVRVLAWADGDRGRVLTFTRGNAEATIDGVVAQVDDWKPLDELVVPEGYTEISYQPFDAWLVTPAIVRSGAGIAQGTAWSAGVVVPVDDTADLVIGSLGLSPDAGPIPGGLAVPREDHWELWFRDAETDLLVTVNAPSELTVAEVAAIPGLVSVVPAAELVEQPLRTTAASPDGTVEIIEAMAPLTAGEIPGHGRWAALDSTPDDAEPGVRCVTFVGVLVGAAGCTDPAGRLMICADLVADNQLRGNDPVLITNDMTVEPSWLAVGSVSGGVGFELGEALTVSTSGGLRVARRTERLSELNQLRPPSFVFGSGRVPAPVLDEPDDRPTDVLCGDPTTVYRMFRIESLSDSSGG